MDYYRDGFRINVGVFGNQALQNCEQFGEGQDPTGLGVDTIWSRGGPRGGVPGRSGSIDLSRAPGRLSAGQLLDCSVRTVRGRGHRRIVQDGSQGSPGAEVQESFSVSGDISWTLTLRRKGCGKR